MNYIDLSETEFNNFKTQQNPVMSFNDGFTVGSESTSTEAENHLQNGGFFFGGSNQTKSLIAARDKKYEALEFMIKENMISNYNTVDDKGNNILHYLAQDYSNPRAKDILTYIINSNSSLSSSLNHKNGGGDTPLHIAVKNDEDSLCDKLIAKGADKTIKNNDGLHVSEESESNTNSNKLLTDNDITIEPPVFSATESAMKSEDTAKFINTLMERVVDKRDTNKSNPLTQLGGKKNTISVGQRRMNAFSDDESMLKRAHLSQATQIHDETIDRIMEIMNLNRDEAKYIKAAIYQKVKSEKPELSGLDRAIEMKKRANKEYIDSLDSQYLKSVRESIIQYLKDKPAKPEQPKQEKPKKETKDKKETKKETKPKKDTKAKKETKKSTKQKGGKIIEHRSLPSYGSSESLTLSDSN
jgi:hypothetical protein